MGLIFSFDPARAGLETELSQVAANGEVVTEPIYMEGPVGAFIDTFNSMYYHRTPIDTGHLVSSISCEGDSANGMVWAEATAEYAQYVEYGTAYQRENPYFRDCLQAAMSAYFDEYEKERSLANEILQAELEAIMAASFIMAGAGEEFVDAVAEFGLGPQAMGALTTGEFIGGMFIFIGLSILLFPILLLEYALLTPLSIRPDFYGFYGQANSYNEIGGGTMGSSGHFIAAGAGGSIDIEQFIYII